MGAGHSPDFLSEDDAEPPAVKVAVHLEGVPEQPWFRIHPVFAWTTGSRSGSGRGWGQVREADWESCPLMVQKQLPLGGPARARPGLARLHGPLWATLRASHCPQGPMEPRDRLSPEAQPEHEAHRARLWVPRRVASPGWACGWLGAQRCSGNGPGSSRTWGRSQQHGAGLRFYGILEPKRCFLRNSEHQREDSRTDAASPEPAAARTS